MTAGTGSLGFEPRPPDLESGRSDPRSRTHDVVARPLDCGTEPTRALCMWCDSSGDQLAYVSSRTTNGECSSMLLDATERYAYGAVGIGMPPPRAKKRHVVTSLTNFA